MVLIKMQLEKTEKNLKRIKSLINKSKLKINTTGFMIRYKNGISYTTKDVSNLRNYTLLNIVNNRIFTRRTQMGTIALMVSQKKKQVNEIIKEIISDLHNKNIPTVSVETDQEEYYRNLSFENTVFKKDYLFNYDQIKEIEIPKQGQIKTGPWSNLIVQNGAVQLYEVPLHSSDERYTLNRPYWYWKLIEKIYPARKLAVYFGRIGLPIAYMFYEQKNNRFLVSELYGTSGEGIQGLLGFLAKKGNPKSQYQVTMPVKSHLEEFFKEKEEITVQIKPQIMTRIIDFPMVLSCMKMIKEGQLNLQVTDSLCEWNNGCWKANFEKGKMQVLKSREEPDYSGDISSWTKVLLGEITLNEAIKLGEIKGNKRPKNTFVKGTVSFFEEY